MTSGTGTCTVKYDQAGDANYNAAPQVTETVNAQKADQTINVTTHAPATAVYNTSFTVAATRAGRPVTFSSAGSCSNTGATFTMTSGTGTCTVKYDQAGDANYNAAPQVTESVDAQKADQSIIVTTHAPATAVFNASFTVAASAAARDAVTFSSAGACSNIGRQLHDDERHRHLHGQVRPGRRRQLQRRPAGDRDGHRAEGEPVDHVTTHAPASGVFGTQFTVAATAAAPATRSRSRAAASARTRATRSR